ncbi:hypothetical protein ABVT39_014423, partial [Epinephelus coioides]
AGGFNEAEIQSLRKQLAEVETQRCSNTDVTAPKEALDSANQRLDQMQAAIQDLDKRLKRLYHGRSGWLPPHVSDV